MTVTRIDPPSKDILLGWTEESTKEYIESKPLAAGDLMIITNTQGGLRTYQLARVENPALGKQRRVMLSDSGTSGGVTFYRSGKNCFHPKGQTRMIPPTEVLEPYLKEPGDEVVLNGLYGQPPFRLPSSPLE